MGQNNSEYTAKYIAEHGAFIESWRRPNVFMRVYRKLLHIMGQW